MQSKIMKKRQRKKNNKNVFIPLIPVEMTEEEVKQMQSRIIDNKLPRLQDNIEEEVDL